MIDSGTLLQGRFLIEERIGMGGMGAVYRAVDQKFGSQVAIKETFYGDTELLAAAFEREARLLNGLHHAIIPHVSDHFTQDGGHFLVMEYIEGEDLSEILKRGEMFPVNTVLSWTLDILDGLDYLHSQNPPVIHRDIKPSNLKLTPRGKIVLLDFGMAKATTGNTIGAKSVFGYSRRYSPLEQIEGTGTDARSDIFSLGATVYQLLTGHPPVDVLARASAIVAGRPDPMLPANLIDSAVPASVGAIIHSALAINADNRFESARAMSNALEYALRSNPVSEGRQQLSPIAVAQHAAAITARDGGTSQPILSSGEEADRTTPMTSASLPVFDDAVSLTVVDEAPAANLVSGNDRFVEGPHTGSMLPPVQIRERSRFGSAVWIPVVLVSLALVLFATYRGFRTEEVVLNNSAEAVANESTATSTDPSTDSAELQTTGRAIPERARSSQNNEGVLSSKKVPVSSRLEAPASRLAAAPKQETRVPLPEPEPVRSTATRNQNKQNAPQRTRRAVQPAFEQPRVSSIEAIFTGVPYERRRRWADDQASRDEDEMRRQHYRRMMRNRQQLPF